jgi:DNA-binding GntR family transcriptional regulator
LCSKTFSRWFHLGRIVPALARSIGAARELEAAATRGDRVGCFRLKRRIHEIEVRAAHNLVLTETMLALHAQSRRFWYTYEPTESFTQGAKLHRAIAEHVVRRDADATAKAVGVLFEFLVRLTHNALRASSACVRSARAVAARERVDSRTG